MSSKSWSQSISLVVSVALFACVDTGCPKGSEEVDGTCMTVDGDTDAGEKTHGVSGANQRDGGRTSGGPSTSPLDSGTGTRNGATTADAAATPDAADGGAADASSDATAQCGSTTCGANADCSDTTGTPVCVCKPGYQGDGQTCVNIDECTKGMHDCSENALCSDTDGSFSCACKPGFEGDGRSCTANPCEARANPCDLATTACRDDDGKAVCDCQTGRARCDADALACHTDLTSDAENCGACDLRCAGNLACHASECDQPIKSLALGYRHSCAIDSEDRIVCWGANDSGQLQRGSSPVPSYEPARTTLGPAKLISAGGEFSCAKLMNDDIVCWGSNEGDQIAPEESPEPPAKGLFMLGSGYTGVTQLASGPTTTCMLNEGNIDCWGRAIGAELGSSTTVFTFDDANRVASPAASLTLTVGFAQACAIGTDHRARCWGPSEATPRELTDSDGNPLGGVVSISSGATIGTGCVALETGRVACWGSNNYGQLGNPAVTSSASENAVTVLDASSTPLSGAVQVVAGGSHACARRNDGTIACWGRRDQLGTGGSGAGAQRSFVEVTAVRDAIDIAVKAGHTCVRRRTGQVQCWGQNEGGQLGVSPTTTPVGLEPVNVIGLP